MLIDDYIHDDYDNHHDGGDYNNNDTDSDSPESVHTHSDRKSLAVEGVELYRSTQPP